MTHINDEILNEYLDHEIDPESRSRVEDHLSVCPDCMRRLAALQVLFDEIESLADVTVTRAVYESRPASLEPFTQPPGLNPPLPRSVRLTVTLQAVSAVLLLVLAAPAIAQFTAPYVRAYPVPSLADILADLQEIVTAWVRSIQSFQVPEIPGGMIPLPIPASAEFISISLVCIFLVWVIGNWWLLGRQSNPHV
jgi:anti-sigma factor RsiW